MTTTLLIGDPESTWREWLLGQPNARDLFVLDPGDTHHGPAGMLRWLSNDQPVATEFFGALDPMRFPQILMATLSRWLAQTAHQPPKHLYIQLFPARPTPALRHLILLVAQMVNPDSIVISDAAHFGLEAFPIGPMPTTLERNYPVMVLAAQRKAHWLRLIERTENHIVSLNTVTLGARLGSGLRVTPPDLTKIGVTQIVYAEKQGASLFVVTDAEISERFITRALEMTHSRKAHIVRTGDYDGVLVSFARQNGEDFGVGYIESVDWNAGQFFIKNTAASPTPVPLLKIGSVRINANGKELEEAKPWSI